MPPSSRWPNSAPATVFVIDTSALIHMKNVEVLKLGDQFGFFEALTPMLRAGSLAYPRHVANELSRAMYPDTPGTWAVGYRDLVVYPDPSDDAMADVLSVAQLVDPQSENSFEEADPYLVAMACDIRDHYDGVRVIVVSDDVKDRMPSKESVATACQRLEIDCWQASEFVKHIKGLPPP